MGLAVEKHDVVSGESQFNLGTDGVVNRAEDVASQQEVAHFKADRRFFAGRHGRIDLSIELAIFIDGDVFRADAEDKIIILDDWIVHDVDRLSDERNFIREGHILVGLVRGWNAGGGSEFSALFREVEGCLPWREDRFMAAEHLEFELAFRIGDLMKKIEAEE